jgi:hypothetical protein
VGDQVRGPADYLELGDWNATCSMCGAKEKASKMVRNWQGLYRHPRCNEPRQPQDFVRGVQDIQTPPWAQPQRDINIGVCSLNGLTDIVGWAEAGCATLGRRYIVPVSGLFGFTFKANVAGQTSGQVTQQYPFEEGTYKFTFNDGEVRQVTFNGLTLTWAPALNNSPPGLFINSGYTIIGAS